MSARSDLDVAIIGAGAAGLAAAVFTRRLAPHLRVVVLDGARSPGAKILVSGGSRCNVTNTVVTEHDYNGGRPAIVRRILRAFPVSETVTFFRELGVGLHEEANGKLFPDSNRSRDVLDALLRGLAAAGGELRASHRVHAVAPMAATGLFEVATSQGTISARRVVLATGGLSLPKTGSDGFGYELARQFGHSIVPTTPALVPLLLADDDWPTLAGVSLPVRLRVGADQTPSVTIDGSMLWTHVGISGPAALDVSRHWLRHRLEGRTPWLRANLLRTPFDAAERAWLARASAHPRQQVTTALSALVPAAIGDVISRRAGVSGVRTLAELSREDRRSLLHALTDSVLPVTDSRGYNYAEVTAGGVTLTEIDPATMQSRITPGVSVIGEILDVDGRLGGFNFQWAWSTAWAAAQGLARWSRTDRLS